MWWGRNENFVNFKLQINSGSKNYSEKWISLQKGGVKKIENMKKGIQLDKKKKTGSALPKWKYMYTHIHIINLKQWIEESIV